MILERKEKEKKRNIANCKPSEKQRWYFIPFVVLMDEIFGFEAKANTKRLAKLLAEECDKPYSAVRGFINDRMNKACVLRIDEFKASGFLQMII